VRSVLVTLISVIPTLSVVTHLYLTLLYVWYKILSVFSVKSRRQTSSLYVYVIYTVWCILVNAYHCQSYTIHSCKQYVYIYVCREGQDSPPRVARGTFVTGQENAEGHRRPILHRPRPCLTSVFHSTCCQDRRNPNWAFQQRHDLSSSATRTSLTVHAYLWSHTRHHRHMTIQWQRHTT